MGAGIDARVWGLHCQIDSVYVCGVSQSYDILFYIYLFDNLEFIYLGIWYTENQNSILLFLMLMSNLSLCTFWKSPLLYH